MAGAPSSFEQIIVNNGPVQTSIMRNLTRWEFRNLQLAGVRFSGSRQLQRKNLIPDRCIEWNPDMLLREDMRCTNTTESLDEIRACSGLPVCISDKSLVMGKRIGGEEIQSCIEDPPWWPIVSCEYTEVNVEKYPVHAKVCSRCRDSYAAINRAYQLQIIARFHRPLCKRHSLEQSSQLPIDACRCFDFVSDKWRCSSCWESTLSYLGNRADVFRTALLYERIPWSQPWEYLRSVWASERRLRCPIEGCFKEAWLDASGEHMQLCMGCNTICKA